jgi:DNA-binding CsgD family transcriptional regulator
VTDTIATPADATEQVRLSGRQQEILVMIAGGMSNMDIGRRLFVSEDTVKTHVRRMYKLLGVATRAEAVGFAYRRGLLTLDTVVPPPRPDAGPAPVTRSPARPARPARTGQDRTPRPVVAVTDRLLTAVRTATYTRNTLVIIRAVLEGSGLAVTRHRNPEQLATAAVMSRRPVIVVTDRMLTVVQGAVLGGDPLVITRTVLEQAGLQAVRAGTP